MAGMGWELQGWRQEFTCFSPQSLLASHPLLHLDLLGIASNYRWTSTSSTRPHPTPALEVCKGGS